MILSGPSQPKDLLLPFLLVLAVLFVVWLIPAVGNLAGIFSPALLIFVFLQRGKIVGLVLIALVFLVILILMGAAQSLLFFAEYGVMAVIMGESIRHQLSLDKCIFFSSLGSAVLSILLLFVLFTDRETSLTDYFQQQIQKHFQQSLETLESVGENQAELDTLRQFVDKSSRTFAAAYPAFILVGSLITAAVNFFLVRGVWTRLYGQTLFVPGTFTQWVLADYWVWLLIPSAASLFLGGGFLGTLGMNIFIVMVVIYFFQGLAITLHIVETRKIPIFFRVLILFLILIQPVLMGIVVGLGVFDIWIDFRKVRTQNIGGSD